MKSACIVLLIALGVAACHLPAPQTPPPPERAGTWYTQFALRYERNRFRTTNYRRGILLPINTEVTVAAVDSNEIVLRVTETGQQLVIENVERHTGQSLWQAFDRVLGRDRVDLDDFSDKEVAAIRDGRVEVGMRRQAVLAALGYPPATGTPTLESSEWKYWDTRFTTFVVRFDGDEVVEVRP